MSFIGVETSTGDIAVIIVALIAAVPATIGALSSWKNGKQLKPNGGSSLADAIRRVETKIDAVGHAAAVGIKEAKTQVMVYDRRLARIEAMVGMDHSDFHPAAAAFPEDLLTEETLSE